LLLAVTDLRLPAILFGLIDIKIKKGSG